MNQPLRPFDVSNTLTYASLLSGVGAFCAALQGSQAACGALLATAVVCDSFDGQLARRLRRRSSCLTSGGADVGGDLDSLVDAVTFGAVPIVCAAVLFSPGGVLWWAAAFVYISCTVTRLAVYNSTAHAASNSPPDFIGLPSPVAALLWSSAFFFNPPAGPLACLALATGLAMLAPFRIPRPMGMGLLLFTMWPAALIVGHVVANR